MEDAAALQGLFAVPILIIFAFVLALIIFGAGAKRQAEKDLQAAAAAETASEANQRYQSSGRNWGCALACGFAAFALLVLILLKF